jgi:hypothetical protein
MNSQQNRSNSREFEWMAALILLVVVFVLGCSKKQENAPAQAAQKTFATPAEAGNALHAAAKGSDDKALTQILGPKAKQLVSSGDAAEDKSATESFARKYDQMNRLVAMTDGSQVLYVGADNYAFPVPLAQDATSRWYFDAAAADEELRARRIGRNELFAMDTCRLIAHAEELYHQRAHQYTDTIVSAPGKQDGLYWETAQGQSPSPMGSLIPSKAIIDGAAPNQVVESHGYSFRVVTGQRGFTIFASPMHYEHSGIMTFSLGKDGVIYQQDLGPQTPQAVAAITQYDSTHGWTQAE